MLSRWFGKKHGILDDVRRSSFQPRVLVSAIQRPFLKGVNFKHNNQTEAVEMADVFHELGYRVDVINYDNPMAVDYEAYEVVFGSGPPLENVFLREGTRRPRAIYYACGAPRPVSNRASLERLEAVRRSRGVWLAGSARLSAVGLPIEELVDGLIVLGNALNAESYRAATARPVHGLPLFCFRLADPAEVMAQRDPAKSRRHFMWFAGSGLVHKGLDLVLEAFSRHPELHLHVYGAIDNEPGFLRAFHHELKELPNVHIGGYLDVRSEAFLDALRESAFMICPSCSEASCSSVLNVCGNGGNIPVITRQCGIDLQDFAIAIDDTTVEAVEAALVRTSLLTDAELAMRQRECAAFMLEEHSQPQYHRRLKAEIQAILG